MVRLQNKEMLVQDDGQKQKKAEEENTSKAQKRSKLVGKKEVKRLLKVTGATLDIPVRRVLRL